jgi:hypothetical protein
MIASMMCKLVGSSKALLAQRVVHVDQYACPTIAGRRCWEVHPRQSVKWTAHYQNLVRLKRGEGIDALRLVDAKL